MKFLKFFLIILLLQITTNIVYAESKVAFLDMQFIMDKSLAGQSIKKQLENRQTHFRCSFSIIK